MKKILFVGMAVAILVGCSDTDDLLTNIPLEEETTSVAELCSNVPIRFADADVSEVMDGSITRGTTGETITLPNLGLFCLAKRPINDGIAGGLNPTWSGLSKNSDLNLLSIWKKNVAVSLRCQTGINKSKVLWDAPNNAMSEEYFPYYPDKDWFAYGFVLYHPRTENIDYTYSTIKAYIRLDGTKRVFYSMAKEPKTVIGDDTDKLGFSKSYYDAISGHDPGVEELIYPYFTFEALTSAVRFNVKSKEEPNTKLHVEKIEFDDFPCIMQLGIADLRRYKTTKVAFDMKSSISKKPFILNQHDFDSLALNRFPDMAEMTTPWGHYELKEEDGTSISGKQNVDGSYKYTLTTSDMLVGGTIYIPPVYKTHSRANLKVYVTIADEAGNKYRNSSPIEVNAPSANGADGWERGKSYTIPLYLNNPAEVANNAALAEWEAADPIEVNATLTNWVQQP